MASLKSPFGRNPWGRKEKRVAGEEKASPMASHPLPFLKPQFLYLYLGLIFESGREINIKVLRGDFETNQRFLESFRRTRKRSF